ASTPPRHRARCTHLQTQPGRIQPIDSSHLAVGLDRPGLAREGRQARGARVGEGRKRARAGVRAPGREASGQHGWRHGRHGW
ncbi:hypothetical protein, partial [Bordetella pertussis]|uniref:hypothetical protein n=15 Tax=Bordetella pertussis TaxID=520 RepID=UPI0036718FF9